PHFDKNRSVRIDSLFFEPDGKIRKVLPTLRGVGVSNALQKIQLDRYSMISDKGVTVDFLDSTDRFKGWKAQFTSPGAWLQYNTVDFGTSAPKKINLMIASSRGATLQLRTGSRSGPVISEITIPKNTAWKTMQAKLTLPKTG